MAESVSAGRSLGNSGMPLVSIILSYSPKEMIKKQWLKKNMYQYHWKTVDMNDNFPNPLASVCMYIWAWYNLGIYIITSIPFLCSP